VARDKSEKHFKVLFLDVGLVVRAQQLPRDIFFQKEITFQNKGALVEQFVGQELLAIQENNEPAKLNFWQRDKRGSQAEVDYVIAMKGDIFPIEVKSGHSHWLKSLKILMGERKLSVGVRVSEQPLNFSDSILSVPLYMIHELPRLLTSIKA